MYYRLLAPCFLPDRLTRILYLDPDILMNLEQGRKEIRPDEIFAYSREHARELLNDNKKSGGKYGILRLMLLKKIICKDKKLTIPEKM